MSRFLAVSALAAIACSSCGSSTRSFPTEVSATTGHLERVVFARNGSELGQEPTVLAPGEAITANIQFTSTIPGDQRATLYFCALESASSIGAGTCTAVTARAAELRSPASLGVFILTSAGAARTTSFLYVALMEGSAPWAGAFTGQGRIPQPGDVFPGGRVFDTYLTARTITFR